MCGILGGNKNKWNYNKALNCMRHRGPDSSRVMQLNNFTLGFVRLSIRDLSEKAMQPMTSENGNISIVFNGELYGCDELKDELIRKGHVFATTSDTEIILRTYMEFGDAFIERIDGMFGLAILDERKKTVTLYRDRYGIKPVLYLWNGRDFAFASELKAIQQMCNDVDLIRDNTAIYDYFTYRYIPEPKTLFKDVYKLEASYKLIYYIEENRVEKEKYYKLHINTSEEARRKKSIIKEDIRELVSNAIRTHLVADVPVGTFLSGGIDSSIVSAEIFRQNTSIKAYSMGFQVAKSEKIYDETSYAKLLTDRHNIPLQVFQFTKQDFRKLSGRIKQWYDEPFADNSAYPTYVLSKKVREHGTVVVLTGDGGDEIFGGYARYEVLNSKIKKHRISMPHVYSFYMDYLSEYFDVESIICEFADTLEIYAQNAYVFTKKMKNKFAKELGIGWGYDDLWYFRKYDHKELPPITRAQYIDLKTYLPADILTKVDRATMQNSIEARVPLLDRKIVEYSFGLSQNERCPNGELKGLLKEAYRGIVPDGILDKEKKGFSMPGSYMHSGKDLRISEWNNNWKER